MDTLTKNVSAEMRAATVVTILLGLWVAVSPFVLGISAGRATWNNVAVGAAVILVAVIGALRQSAILGAIVPLSAWLFASTFIPHPFNTHLMWNNVISAFALIAQTAYGGALITMPSPHHEAPH